MLPRVMLLSVALFACASIAPAQEAPAQAAAVPVPASPASVPISQFAALPFLEGPELSPDGTHVAAQVSIDGQWRLAIIPLADTSKMVTMATGEVEISGLQWVNNDWLIVHVQNLSSVEGDKWILRRAIAVSADGKKINSLGDKIAAQNADDVLWTARDGSPHALIAMQTSIYANTIGLWPEVRDFDVSTGKSKVVVASTANVGSWYADTKGAVRLGISYEDGRRAYRLLYRDGATGAFRTVERARGPRASLGNVPALFLPDPGKGVAFDDDDGFDALYDFDFIGFKKGAKLFGTPGYDLDGVITDTAGTRVIGARYTDTRSRIHWFDPVLEKVQADIDKAVGTRQAHIVSWNSDFSVLMVLVGGADRPGAYYLFRPAEGSMHLFAQINPVLSKMGGLSPVSTIRYKARDGLEMTAVLTLPKGKSATSLPLILMPHGGPSARDDESWDWWAQFVASRGYAVLQPNYRGSTGYGTDFYKKGEGQWGLAMQDDLTDAVHWATSTGLADAKRVCIVGGSYGGYAALRAAQRDKGIYRCAVAFAGVSDMVAMLHYDGSFLNGRRSADSLRAQAPDLKGVSPINFAGDFSIPVLLMHGKADMTVPVKQSREMAEKLKAAGKPFRYVEQPLGDHHLSRQADRVQFLTELDAFLKANNPS